MRHGTVIGVGFARFKFARAKHVAVVGFSAKLRAEESDFDLICPAIASSASADHVPMPPIEARAQLSNWL